MMTQLVEPCVRVKEYENGNPYILLERQCATGAVAADAMKPFASDLRPGVPMAEVEALVAEMRRVITHVHFEAPPVDPWWGARSSATRSPPGRHPCYPGGETMQSDTPAPGDDPLPPMGDPPPGPQTPEGDPPTEPPAPQPPSPIDDR